MKIVLGEWFSLPRLGKDQFLRLVREAGLKYDKAHGFRTTSNTDLYLVSSLLSGALQEDVVFTVKCFICGEEVACHKCIYDEACDRRRVSPNCICDECKEKPEATTLYSMRFAELAEW